MPLDATLPNDADARNKDREFWQRFDEARARVLRRRIRWYSIAMLALLALSVGGTMTDVVNPTYADGSPNRTVWLGFASDFGLVALYAGALAYVLWRAPDRRHLVGMLVVVTVAAVPLASVIETLIVLVDEPRSRGGDVPDDDPSHATWIAATNALAPVFMACLLVPMRMGESLRMAIPATLVCVAVHAFILKLPGGEVVGWALGLGVAMVVCMLWSAWRYREMDARFQARDTAEQFRQVSSELTYARRIHEALFPPPISSGAVRLAYRYEPMREIGGDFLFVWPLPFPPSELGAGGGPLSVVLIDVSGHGVPAALAVNRLHGELRRFFGSRPSGTSAELVSELNRFAYEELSRAGVFATALCVRIDAEKGELEFANAGHPPAFVRDAAGGVRELAATATMLGVLEPEEFDHQAQVLRVSRGDRLVAYTDGLSEATNSRGEQFGIERVRALVATGDGSQGDLTRAIAKQAEAFRSGRAQDDLLVVDVLLTP